MSGIVDIFQKLRKLKVVIVTHVFATGPAQELEEYLKEKVEILVFIGHPLFCNTNVRSFYEIYENGTLIKEKKTFKLPLKEPISYLKDVYYTILWILSIPTKFDLYVGANPLNALVGIIFKRIRKVKKVVFYSIDYTPRRFNNRFLNWIYHRIDTFCAKRSDFVWNLSSRMIEARERKGVKRKGNQLVVPIGVHNERINLFSSNSNNKRLLVYMGHLREGQGLNLIIDSFPEIVRKFPDIKFIIIGTGKLEKYLKYKIKNLKLEKYIKFMGYIEDHKKVEEILTTCTVGLAVYEPNPHSFTWYADPSKPKQYMACGLPVIITRVPWIAEEVERRQLGIVIDYEKKALINAILRFLKDNNFYNTCRKNALRFASEISWDKIFKKALMHCLIGL